MTAAMVSTADLATQSLQAVLIVLGSNDNAMVAMACAIGALGKLGQVHHLGQCQGADTKNRSKAMYNNQAVVVIFAIPIRGEVLGKHLKQIEQDCGRDERQNTAQFDYKVAMDLDILAVKTDNIWAVVRERYPFKDYEWACVGEFIAKNLNNQTSTND